jgi:hypothetical protein
VRLKPKYLNIFVTLAREGSAANEINSRFSAVMDPVPTSISPRFFSRLPTVQGFIPLRDLEGLSQTMQKHRIISLTKVMAILTFVH